MTKRVAVIGAGGMARVRTKAFLATNKATICGVASRTLSSARSLGKDIGCNECFADYHRLAETSPDAVLVEVPPSVQDDPVLWALDQGLHVLIGGCLASSSSLAERILATAKRRSLVVEAGFNARYSAAWATAKGLLADGTLGKLSLVRSIALWDGDPKSWYYSQALSGGMPLVHMAYCFINPIRWILGDPLCVSAFANSAKHTALGMIEEETCVANFRFGDDVICSMIASFIKLGDVPGWSVLFLGTNGAVEILPREEILTIYHSNRTETRRFASARDAFEVQAEVFLGAIDGTDECRNTPAETVGDIRAVEAIVNSSKQEKTVWIEGNRPDDRQGSGARL